MKKKFLTFEEVKFAASDEATMTFSGYASVFNNLDLGGDAILPGAFKKTLKSDPKPLMLLNHKGFGDTLPIGTWLKFEEDEYGLKVEGRFLDTTAGKDTHIAAKAGAITGLSIGYIVKDVKYGKPGTDEPARLLKEVQLLEVSVVTFPMNQAARITSVKSFEAATDFEAELTELGMSLKDARAFLEAHASKCQTKYQEAAVNVAARNLLSKLQGEK